MSSTNPEKYRFFIAEDCDKANSIFAIGCCFYGNTGGTPGNFPNGSGERRRNFFPADSGGGGTLFPPVLQNSPIAVAASRNVCYIVSRNKPYRENMKPSN